MPFEIYRGKVERKDVGGKTFRKGSEKQICLRLRGAVEDLK